MRTASITSEVLIYVAGGFARVGRLKKSRICSKGIASDLVAERHESGARELNRAHRAEMLMYLERSKYADQINVRFFPFPEGDPFLAPCQ